MKRSIYIAVFLIAGCQQPIKAPDKVKSVDTLLADKYVSNPDRTKYYITKDTVIIATESADTLTFSRQDFNEIVDNFPELYNEVAMEPEITYYSGGIFKDSIAADGCQKHITFGSEVGQDRYYILYAYFLKKKTGEKRFAEQRRKLTKIYNDINDLFGCLNYGGTCFGHQSSRIAAYTEYSVYLYAKGKDYFTKKYLISNQKQYYIRSLKQLIKDEVSTDNAVIESRLKREKILELNKFVDDLDNLIMDNFYLKQAQAFHYSHYLM